MPQWRWASACRLPALRRSCPGTVRWQGCCYQRPPSQRPVRGLPHPQSPASLSPHHPKPDPAPAGPPRAGHSPKRVSLEGTRVIFSGEAAVLVFLTRAVLLGRIGDALLWGWEDFRGAAMERGGGAKGCCWRIREGGGPCVPPALLPHASPPAGPGGARGKERGPKPGLSAGHGCSELSFKQNKSTGTASTRCWGCRGLWGRDEFPGGSPSPGAAVWEKHPPQPRPHRQPPALARSKARLPPPAVHVSLSQMTSH